MQRILSLTALLLAFAVAAPTLAEAANPPKKKPGVTRQVKRWTTPPGYRTPEQIEREEVNEWRRDRAIARRHNTPQAYYYYYSSPYYYSGRFASDRFGAHSGPCWTQTPIGAVRNCGK